MSCNGFNSVFSCLNGTIANTTTILLNCAWCEDRRVSNGGCCIQQTNSWYCHCGPRNSFSGGAIAGVVISVIGAILCCVMMRMCCLRRRRGYDGYFAVAVPTGSSSGNGRIPGARAAYGINQDDGGDASSGYPGAQHGGYGAAVPYAQVIDHQQYEQQQSVAVPPEQQPHQIPQGYVIESTV